MKKIIMIIGLVTLILFSGCSSIERYEFCKSKLHEFSNATEIKNVYFENGYIGCSDGHLISWYDENFYLNEKIELELYE